MVTAAPQTGQRAVAFGLFNPRVRPRTPFQKKEPETMTRTFQTPDARQSLRREQGAPDDAFKPLALPAVVAAVRIANRTGRSHEADRETLPSSRKDKKAH
jgi:hypothetical protein